MRKYLTTPSSWTVILSLITGVIGVIEFSKVPLPVIGPYLQGNFNGGYLLFIAWLVLISGVFVRKL